MSVGWSSRIGCGGFVVVAASRNPLNLRCLLAEVDALFPLMNLFIYDIFCNTVDGRNPAPVDMENLPLFTGFYTSQVVQDFFHQQYCTVTYHHVSM